MEWVIVKKENPPLYLNRPWMVVLQHPKEEAVFMVVDRVETQAEAEDIAGPFFLMVEDIQDLERDQCVDSIMNGPQFFLAGIEPEMREAVVRRALTNNR
jgi:hypothetical protein